MSVKVGATYIEKKALESNSFNYALEGMRGLAAIIVVLGHALSPNSFIEKGYKLSGFWQYGPPAHLSVVFFFALSGYVIGITNKKSITSWLDCKIYIKKRVVRLYPIYIIALLMGVFVAYLYGNKISLNTMIAYVFFGQVLFAKVFWENGPLWSLSYEMVYYLLFIIVSCRKINPLLVASGCVVLGLIITKFHILPYVLVSYLHGAAIWFIGLWIARLDNKLNIINYGKILAFIFLMLCYERMNLISSMLQSLHLDVVEKDVPSFFERAITFSDLSYLIICVPLIIALTNKRLSVNMIIEYIAFLVPFLYSIAYIVSGKMHDINLLNTLIVAVVFYIISIFVYFSSDIMNSIGRKIVDKISWFGGISFGIYVVHFPILLLVSDIKFFYGSWYTILIRMVVYFLVVCVISYILEKKYQTFFKRIIG